MSKVFDAIFPFVANWKVNKKLRERLSNQELQGILSDNENAAAISTDVLKDLYSDTMRMKDKLEDKAKINVVGITITSTLIMGATGILTTIYEKVSSTCHFLDSIYSVCYCYNLYVFGWYYCDQGAG